MAINLIILIICILLSAFFSATETAFTSLSAIQIQQLLSKNKKTGKQIRYLTERPEILLTTILIGNNLVNIAAASIATQITLTLFSSKALGASTGILTLIILIFAEVNPKRIAILYNEWIAVHTARVIHYLSILFRPGIWLISGISNVLGRFYSRKREKKISMDGIFHMFTLAETEGVVENYETKLIRNVFRFNDVQVHAIMTHRTEVFSLNKEELIVDILPQIIEHGFSRIPVYDKDPELVVGIILTRDIMKCVTKKTLKNPVSTIMVEPIFVSESKKVNDLFKTFQKELLNIAVVLDEYGGLAGIVTMEDAVEEILGEIYDEYDNKERDKVIQLTKKSFRLQGDTSIEQAIDILDLTMEHEKHVQTVGGYLIETLGRFPKKREVIETKHASFTIEEIKKHRIIQVLCRLKNGDS